jgi:hypothetical protein
MLAPYKDKLLVATAKNVFIMDPGSFTPGDTIWRERSTAVFASNDTII